ncbi:MAG: hypothetical protein DIU63_06325 [Proteobacteria bacterium]|jgi:hypothetical protein|nr:MAG: hypothetical protein DIU63_06325 [Pseudomonadota bacterium]
MPTEILRRGAKPPAARDERERAARAGVTDRYVLIRAGAVAITARLRDTPTADRIWLALPIFSTAQVWGQGEVFFETPVESGRERTARMIARPGEIIFAPDRDVIGIPFAPGPTSRAGELRLWSASNIWAEALGDVSVFRAVRPGERVEVRRVEAPKVAASV